MPIKALKLVVFVLFAFLFNTDAKSDQSINLVLKQHNWFSFGITEPANLDSYVVFIDHNSVEKKVWSYNKTTKTFTDLNLDGATEIITFKQLAVITVPVDDMYNRVLITDGTPEGYEHVTSKADHGYLKTENNLYFFKGTTQIYADSDVYRIDGITSYHHQRSGFISDYSVCESADGTRFSMVTEGSNFQGSNGEFSLVGDFFPTSPRAGGFQIKAMSGYCYVFKTVSDGNQSQAKLIEVFVNANTKNSFIDNGFVQNLSGFTEFKGKLYAIENTAFDLSYKIHQLDYETLTSINSVEVQIVDNYTDESGTTIPIEFLFYFNPPVLSKNNHYLITGNPIALLFDEQLEPVEILNETSSRADLLSSDKPDFYHVADTAVIAKNTNSQLLYNAFPELLIISGNAITSQFKSNDNILIESLFVNPSKDAVSLLARDNKNQQKGFYEISERRIIDHTINGSWYNPEYKSQGLSILKGRRQDGSEYVFLTAYLFRNGKPLWVAGVDDLEDNPETLNIQLYEFNGLQFLQANQAANQISFGSIDLQLSGCHTLETNINSPTGSDEITFYRAENTGIEDWCQ